jgi:hypothetical protein
MRSRYACHSHGMCRKIGTRAPTSQRACVCARAPTSQRVCVCVRAPTSQRVCVCARAYVSACECVRAPTSQRVSVCARACICSAAAAAAAAAVPASPSGRSIRRPEIRCGYLRSTSAQARGDVVKAPLAGSHARRKFVGSTKRRCSGARAYCIAGDVKRSGERLEPISVVAGTDWALRVALLDVRTLRATRAKRAARVERPGLLPANVLSQVSSLTASAAAAAGAQVL